MAGQGLWAHGGMDILHRLTARRDQPFHARRPVRRPFAAVLVLLGLSMPVLGLASPVGADPVFQLPVDYVALGDSYTAMNVSSFPLWGSPCYRSSNAFPSRIVLPGTTETIAGDSESGYVNVSCSGATTADIPSQAGSVNGSTDLVTITIGGNDAGFVDAWESCRSGDCTQNPNLGPAVVDRLLPTVESTLRTVRSRSSATVVLATYPNLFDASAPCSGSGSGFTQSEWDLAQQYNSWLNDMLETAAARAGVHVADAEAAFGGHGLCSATPWVAEGPFGTPPHPNTAGHAAYADTIEAALSEAASAFPTDPSTGLPHNPDPQPGVSVFPVESCRLTREVRSFDKVRIVGSGFAPGSAVALELAGTAGSALLPSVTASASGQINTTVLLPATYVGGTALASGLHLVAASGQAPGGMALVTEAELQVDEMLPVCDPILPTVQITSPVEGAVYKLNQAVTPEFSCSDDRMLVSCTPSSSGALPTDRLGERQYSVTATDLAGNQRTVTITYRVEYVVGKVSPLAQSTVWLRAGDPFTGRFLVRDARGVAITTPKAISWARAYPCGRPTTYTQLPVSISSEGMVTVSTPPGNDGDCSWVAVALIDEQVIWWEVRWGYLYPV